jgi:hypothetical protein
MVKLATELVAGHPEAETSVEEVEETLREELSGVFPEQVSPSQAGS